MDKQAIIKALRDTAQSASNSVAETASAPIDAITWALRKAGLPVPENAVGSSDWMAQKGLTAPVEAGIPKMAGEVLGNVVPAIGFAKAPQIARGMNRMVDNAMAPATMNKQSGKVLAYPQDEALATAQRNAAKPVSEGGLGLHPDNTAMERAKAMGFETDSPYFHGTKKNFEEFAPSRGGIFFTDDKKLAKQYGSKVKEVYLNKGNAKEFDAGGAGFSDAAAYRFLNDNTRRMSGDASVIMKNFMDAPNPALEAPLSTVVAINRPSQARYTTAAFDPARRNEADLLGRADPRLLGLIGLGTGAGVYGANK